MYSLRYQGFETRFRKLPIIKKASDSRGLFEGRKSSTTKDTKVHEGNTRTKQKQGCQRPSDVPVHSSAVGGRACEADRVLREPRFELQHTGSPPKETALEIRPILLAKSLRDVTRLADSLRGILIRNRVSVAPLAAVYTLTYQLTR